MAVTVLDCYRRESGNDADEVTAGDLAEYGYDLIGGCYGCRATIAAYNAYPTRVGYWACKDCVGDRGFDTVEVFLAWQAAFAAAHE